MIKEYNNLEIYLLPSAKDKEPSDPNFSRWVYTQ